MKKISANTVKTFMKENSQPDSFTFGLPVGENTFDVQVRTVLTVDEKSLFIRRVVSGCFDEDGNYRPEYKLPVIHATILQMCTNLPPVTLKGETDVLDLDAMERLYLLIEGEIEGHEEYGKFEDDITNLCGTAIIWEQERILHKTSASFDELIASLRNVINKLSEKIDALDMDSVVKYAGELAEATKGLGEGDIVKGLIAAQKQADS